MKMNIYKLEKFPIPNDNMIVVAHTPREARETASKRFSLGTLECACWTSKNYSICAKIGVYTGKRKQPYVCCLDY